jgi:hypothetical protein
LGESRACAVPWLTVIEDGIVIAKRCSAQLFQRDAPANHVTSSWLVQCKLWSASEAINVRFLCGTGRGPCGVAGPARLQDASSF